MRFSVCYDFRNPVQWHKPYAQLYNELLEQIEWADSLGAFEHVWLSEHHFTDDGYLPAIAPMMAAIAERTQRLQIGSQILLAPLHHPLRLAEDLAVVDQLSNGRLNLGLAVGYRPKEFEVLGISKSERGTRTSETIEILQRAWTGRRFSYHGEHFDFDDVIITPPPLQSQFPPIWVGGSSPAAARRAAKYGCHFMSDEGTTAEVYQLYLKTVRDEGLVSPLRISTTRSVYVCDDPEEGWNDVKEHFLYAYNRYRDWYAEAGQLDEIGPAVKDADSLPRELHIVGTPSDVIAAISNLRKNVPLDSLGIWAHPPGFEIEKTTRSLELFADQVVPALADL